MTIDVVANKVRKEIINSLQLHQRELLAFLVSKLSNTHDAEDVYQSLYLKLNDLDEQKIERIKDHKRYIFKAANNMAIDALRKRNKTIQAEYSIEEADTVSAPDRIIESNQKAAALKAAIAAMPPKRRQVFLLFKFKSMSRSEISYELDMKHDAVEKHLVRALKDCRDFLNKAGVH